MVTKIKSFMLLFRACHFGKSHENLLKFAVPVVIKITPKHRLGSDLTPLCIKGLITVLVRFCAVFIYVRQSIAFLLSKMK